MTGNKFLILILSYIVYISNLIGQEVSIDIDPYGEMADIQASKFKTPGSDCLDYLAKKNRQQFKQMKIEDTTVLFICGESSVIANPNDKNFLVSRMNAFDKAIVNGIENYSKFRGQIIAEQISYSIKAGINPNKIKSAKEIREEALNSEEIGIFDKLKSLANEKIDKRLLEEGIDPESEKEKVLKVVSNITESSSFRKTLETYSRISISGIQVAKVWEKCQINKPCRVAVLLARTPEQVGIAKAILNENSITVRGKPGKPIPKEWKVRDILANIGARIRRDENGNYHVLATAIAVPQTNNDTSLNVAYKNAGSLADGFIRKFAGAIITSNINSNISEIENISNLGNSDSEINQYLNAKITANSEAAKIYGISLISQGPVIHPVNPDVNAVYVIKKWSFESQANAKKPLNVNNPKNTSDNEKSSKKTSNTSLESEEADF